MTWEQKLEVIKSVSSDAYLKMRKPGNWYCSVNLEIGGDGLLSSAGGEGQDPESAVNDCWETISNLKHPMHVRVLSGPSRGRRVRWNGFMWDEVAIEKAVI